MPNNTNATGGASFEEFLNARIFTERARGRPRINITNNRSENVLMEDPPKKVKVNSSLKKDIYLSNYGFSKELDLLKTLMKQKKFGLSYIKKIKIKCHYCSKMVYLKDLAILTDIKYLPICKDCAHKAYDFRYCPKCKTFHSDRNICYCEFNAKPKKVSMLRYNFKGLPKYFRLNDNDKMLFGIEIEVEFNDQSLDSNVIKELYKKEWLLFKYDGTIGNGFEIVTQPLGWRWLKKNKDEFNVIFNLAPHGLTSKNTTTCGTHIHINKEMFTTGHLYKFMKFFYLNKEFIIYISERDIIDMQTWAYFSKNDEANLVRNCIDKWVQDKHCVINLQNPETVEVRIFKGTLNKFTFWKNIEFVKSLFEFTSMQSMRKNDLTENKYLNYIEEEKEEFPYLYKYLKYAISKRSLI